MALTLTETFHFSFAYSAKALRAASWMNFDTGVMRLSSFSIGAGPCAELWAGTIGASSAARTAMTRTMNASLSMGYGSTQPRARSTARRQPA